MLAESAIGPAFAAFWLLAAIVVLPTLGFMLARAIGRWAYPGEPLIGWLRLASLPYLRYFQHLRVEGRHFVPDAVGPEGLIVVSNHCAGLDPVALQSAMRHPIRWMMSAEMMRPEHGWAWRRLRIIPVCFDARDATALKTAIAHVASGGTLGIFPEGAIERPARQLRPFSGGLRLILARTKAPVLVALIDPGFTAETAYGALMKPTHARVRFLARFEPGPDGHARDTAERIFELMKRESGWPVTDVPLAPADPAEVERNLRAYVARG
jgi:1-acyl-sn-glycerol-3-phosphate acyltransferase